MNRLSYLFSLLLVGALLAGCDAATELTGPDRLEKQEGRHATLNSANAASGPINVTPGTPGETDLVAGQHTVVGKVSVDQVGSDLEVKYIITDGSWCLTQTHLDAKDNPDDFPQKNGNPQNGHFAYAKSHDCVSEVTYTIPVPTDDNNDGSVFLAAHADVETIGTVADLSEFEALLPATTSFLLQRLQPRDSYVDVTINDGSIIDGTWDAWCIDTDRTIVPGATYNAGVYSSYSSDVLAGLGGLIEKPENLDLVNWILNQNYVGTTASDGQPFTFSDVQRAIWSLVDDQNSTEGLGTWTQDHVDQILTEASANGEDFTPGCGDLLGVVLVPRTIDTDNTRQLLIFGIPVVCEGKGDTAWGRGMGFPGANWAMYFEYLID